MFKKLNSNGFSYLELLVIILVAGVIAGSGYYVYRYEKSNGTAHASSWTELALKLQNSATEKDISSISGVACQTKLSTSYEVETEITDNNATSVYLSYDVYANVGGSGGNKLASTKNVNVATSGHTQDINFSIPFGGYFSVLVFDKPVSGSPPPVAYFYIASNGSQPSSIGPSSLADCSITTIKTTTTSGGSPQTGSTSSYGASYSGSSLASFTGGSSTGSDSYSFSGTPQGSYLGSASASSFGSSDTGSGSGSYSLSGSKPGSKSHKSADGNSTGSTAGSNSNGGFWQRVVSFFKNLV